jgi:hypothetical protein
MSIQQQQQQQQQQLIAAYFGLSKKKKVLTSFTSSFLQKTLEKKDGFSGESKSMLSSESESSNGSNAAPASLIARM